MVLIAVLVLTFSSTVAAQAVRRNDVPADVDIGNQRVMRLASTPGLTVGERVAAVHQYLATLQGNYPTFNTNRIVVVEKTDFKEFVGSIDPELWGRKILPRALLTAWSSKRPIRAPSYPLVIGYRRLPQEPAFVGEEFLEPIYIYAASPNDRSFASLDAIIVPIVTVTKYDAVLHKTTAQELAELWKDNIKRAFKKVK